MTTTKELVRQPVQNSERVLRDLLELADVQVNGSRPWDIQVHDQRFYGRVLREANLGAGEAYMDGWWDCDALDQFFYHVLEADVPSRLKGDWKLALSILQARLINLQSPSRAYEVGERHYDLGNDLYQAMLDKRLNYTCAYWKDAANLDEAQEAKLELVCKKIGLKPGMKILVTETKGKIVLTPQTNDPVDALFGKLAVRESLTKELLADRRKERDHEKAKIHSR